MELTLTELFWLITTINESFKKDITDMRFEQKESLCKILTKAEVSYKNKADEIDKIIENHKKANA